MSLETIVNTITSSFTEFSFKDGIDILIIAVLIYYLITLTKGTRAYQVLKGVGLFFIATIICELFDFATLNWLLSSVLVSGILIIAVLFQPELRRAFERLGRGQIFDRKTGEFGKSSALIINELHRATLGLAKRRVGALIVIEQRTGLGDIISTGTKIDGIISDQLIENIFEPNTPLHDGAMIIRGGNIAAAGCFLPLFDDPNLAKELGTRHRAALGVSSISDSVTIVVSEETGVISIAREGKLIRYIDSRSLKDTLESLYSTEKEHRFIFFKRRNVDEK